MCPRYIPPEKGSPVPAQEDSARDEASAPPVLYGETAPPHPRGHKKALSQEMIDSFFSTPELQTLSIQFGQQVPEYGNCHLYSSEITEKIYQWSALTKPKKKERTALRHCA